MPRPSGADPLTALRDLSEDVALSKSQIAEAVAEALLETYHRLIDEDAQVRASVDLARGTWQVYRVEDGVEVAASVDLPDFPRQAAAAVRAAVAGRVEEASRKRVLDAAAAHHGQLVDAIPERKSGLSWYVDAAGFPGLLPPEEQMQGERLERGRHIKVVVLEGRRRVHDAVVVVSRSHPLLVQRLLEQEVPELLKGQVVIRGMAREAGRRTKVAVEAPDGDIDPQGACIGPRGVRQRAVTSELGEEQVQIVAWSHDPSAFVANSLIPATVTDVTLDEPSRTARVTVPAEQLSLAIGRAGENARLAARLTGWRIDIAAPVDPA